MTGPPLVIYNPKAGRGLAGRAQRTFRDRLTAGAEIVATHNSGHAVELARDAVSRGVRWILSAGGDGTVHEVINGILQTGNRDVVFQPLPLGSANDYAFTLGLVDWWNQHRSWESLQTMAVDVASISSGDRREWFANGCGVGFNGMVTVEARKIRWLRGIPLYALAVLKALYKHYDAPVLNLMIDGVRHDAATLALTLGLAQREGGFPLTAAAKLDDGMLDILRVGAIRRSDLIRHLPSMITGNLPKDHQDLSFASGREIQVESPKPMCIHIDGEFFCRPEDNIRDVRIEVFPKRLQVAVDPQYLYGGEAFRHLRSGMQT